MTPTKLAGQDSLNSKKRQMNKKDFHKDSGYKVYQYAVECVDKLKQSVTDGKLIIKDDQILLGVYSYGDEGVPGVGIKRPAGYTHLFGNSTIIGGERKIVFEHTKKEVKDHFSSLRIADPKEFENFRP